MLKTCILILTKEVLILLVFIKKDKKPVRCHTPLMITPLSASSIIGTQKSGL